MQDPADAEDIRREVGCLNILREHPTISTLKATYEDEKVTPHLHCSCLFSTGGSHWATQLAATALAYYKYSSTSLGFTFWFIRAALLSDLFV